MSDLISRKALLEEINKNFSFKTVGEILYEINIAPAITQGEPVAYMNDIGFAENLGDIDEYYGKAIPLYITPPQPQTMKDALEEAVKICETLSEQYVNAEAYYRCANAIRALIEK